MSKQDLIDILCQQIKEDAIQGDLTVLDEILQNVPLNVLVNSLPEDEMSKFDGLVQADLQEKRNERKICWWSIADVEHIVNEHNEDEDNSDDQIEFSDELGHTVLDIVEDRFDANYGVDWDSLRDALSDAR